MADSAPETSSQQGQDFDVRWDHHAGPTRYLEDFRLGETFYIPSRTLTDALFAAFQLASGDNDPIHYDVEYCRAHGHPHMLAHGLQILIQTAAGAGTFPQQVRESLVAMIEVSGRNLKPVYCGDTVYPLLTVSDIKVQNTTGVLTLAATVHNQDSVLVFEGQHKYLIRRKPTG